MISFNGDVIKMMRNDSAFIHLDILTATGEHYEPSEGDKITFYVRRQADKWSKPIIRKDYNNKDMSLEIKPEDTRFLTPGEYYYDTVVKFADDKQTSETVNNGRFYLIY